MNTHKLRAIWLAAALVGVGTLAVGLGVVRAAPTAKDASPLRTACGATVVVQTDWFPSPEHGGLYQLAGTNGTYDASKGRYTGVIKGTGVKLEIRAGGPFTGFAQPISQMYQDNSITLGYSSTDEDIRSSANLPVVQIFAPMEFSPQILMWNPQKLTINRFQDIGNLGAPVLVFEGGAYYDYLVGRGWINRSQIDTSYDGSPTRFVVADGAIVQQGFATNEPYQYEYVYEQYKKPVKYLLIKNSGFVPYTQSISARAADIRSKAPCFKRLVPLMQKAQVDFIAKPQPVLNKLIEYVTAMKTFWTLTPGDTAYNITTQKRLRIVQNGPNCTLGDFRMKRVEGTINQLVPIFAQQGIKTVKAGLKATDLATNQFIDPKIHLPKKGCK